MTIKLRDYDLAAANRRLVARVARERGIVHDWRDGLDIGFTEFVRGLHKHGVIDSAPAMISTLLLMDLSSLPEQYGGTVTAVEGGYAACPEFLTLERPLVRAVMLLRGHPHHGEFSSHPFVRTEQPASYAPVDVSPMLERLYASDPQAWDLARFDEILFEGACRYSGDIDIESDWMPDMIYPGSHVGRYMSPIAYATVFDAVGAFDPAFTRRDALVGEWWLLQPVSPRLSHHHLAQKFGLHYAGILPPAHVDAAGRVVLACFPTQEMSDAHRSALLEDSKFVAGFEKVLWAKGQPPLDDPAFDLARLEGVTEESYGPYRHSSELPRWPPR